MQIWIISSKTKQLIFYFWIPFIVLIGIIAAILLKSLANLSVPANIILLAVVFLGSYKMVKQTLTSLFQGNFALDYIAILAVIVSIFSKEYLVAAILALMLASGRTLEEYGMSQAKLSLSALIDRIPNTVHLWENSQLGKKSPIHSINIGQVIAVRKGEVIPLDGILESDQAFIDESSLSGEPFTVEKIQGDQILSGTVNVGNIIVIKVTKKDINSTYNKIVNMVKEAQNQKAPFIRLANKYSLIFTLLTLLIAAVTYALSQDFSRVLSVLVIATPCPLILATPIALLGGMNSAAKQKIILKKISSIEVLARVNALVFDKTGTITLGKPSLTKIIIKNSKYSKEQILSIASAIERSSLHPLAKAIVNEANNKNLPVLPVINIEEKIGIGISGIIEGKKYLLAKTKNSTGMTIELTSFDKTIAIFMFEDQIKTDTKIIIQKLRKMGLILHIFTGDKKEAAEAIVKQLGYNVSIKSECTPQNKKDGIKILKNEGKTTAMIGDGINDAPALAIADVGMVFSNEEHTAASEAADIVFLVGDLGAVTNIIGIAKRSIRIATQSIVLGIGLSIAGMIMAGFGFISPITSAFTQEAIDVLVIFNALRASKG
jgi:heavy metal translocating P-type ATPase